MRQERREKRLEESRKVVLVEDASLPTPTKVSSNLDFVVDVSRGSDRVCMRVVQDCDARMSAGSEGVCVGMGSPSL